MLSGPEADVRDCSRTNVKETYLAILSDLHPRRREQIEGSLTFNLPVRTYTSNEGT